MPPEHVYLVWDFYDGVRSGIAGYRGSPHYFDCEFDHGVDDYSPSFRLWPIDKEIFDLALEQWQIYRAWERIYISGGVSAESHPGNRGQDRRYDEIQARLHEMLKPLGPPAHRAIAWFEARADQQTLPAGCIRELEVEWSDVV